MPREIDFFQGREQGSVARVSPPEKSMVLIPLREMSKKVRAVWSFVRMSSSESGPVCDKDTRLGNLSVASKVFMLFTLSVVSVASLPSLPFQTTSVSGLSHRSSSNSVRPLGSVTFDALLIFRYTKLG